MSPHRAWDAIARRGGRTGASPAKLRVLQGSVPAALAAHRLAAEARAHERLGDLDTAVRLLRQAVTAAPHPAEARALAQRAQDLQSTL
jgi:Flp pilus assembly protein TadD